MYEQLVGEVLNNNDGDEDNAQLLSLILISYNQNDYICQAIEGVLSQTYSPLEVIISDDHSIDGTWEQIKSTVAKYNGPHRVVLNRNASNLGINQHINEACRLASGSFMVIAGGDDISLATRCAELFEVWKSGASGVFSNASVFNPDSPAVNRTLGDENYKALGHWQEMIQVGSHGSWGCALGWDRRIYDIFGDIPPSPLGEDAFIPFRCALVAGFAYIPKPLVKYRDHGGNISFWAKDKRASRCHLVKLGTEILEFEIGMYKCWLQDVRVAAEQGLLSAQELEWAEKTLGRHIKISGSIIRLLQADILLMPFVFIWSTLSCIAFGELTPVRKMLHLLLRYRFSRIYRFVQKRRGREI